MDKDDCNSKIHQYWEKCSTESMYDKNLLELEINLIKSELKKDNNVLDLGCGEGEGTKEYSKITPKITAVDFSKTRLKLLSERAPSIKTKCFDMRDLSASMFEESFDVVITQRSLINLSDESQQIDVINRIHQTLAPKGRYIMLEGFREEGKELNRMREFLEMSPIEERWHNLFLNRKHIMEHVADLFILKKERKMNTFFFLSRVINASLIYPDAPAWNDKLNIIAKKLEEHFPEMINTDMSRLKLLIFEKI